MFFSDNSKVTIFSMMSLVCMVLLAILTILLSLMVFSLIEYQVYAPFVEIDMMIDEFPVNDMMYDGIHDMTTIIDNQSIILDEIDKIQESIHHVDQDVDRLLMDD